MKTLLLIDCVGSILSYFSVVGFVRLERKAWLISCVSNIINACFFFKIRLFANAGLRLTYLATNLIGYFSWKGIKQNKNAGIIDTVQWQIVLYFFLGMACMIGFVPHLLYHIGIHPSMPYWDTWLVYMCLSATYLSARRHLYTWLLWAVIDIASLWVYAKHATPFHLILMIAYLPLAWSGYCRWKATMHMVDQSQQDTNLPISQNQQQVGQATAG